MKNLKRLGVLLTAVGAICLLAGTQPVKATEKATIAEGVYIGNVNVGGMTQAQAQSAVEEYVAGLMDTTFTLKGESGSVSMTAQDMGVTADVNAAVTEAVAVGRAGSLINRYKTTQDLKKNSLVLDMHLSVDKQTTAQKLYKDSDKLSVAAVDNGLVRENGAFQFVRGKEGVEVNIVDSVYAINDFLADEWNGTNNEIELVTDVVEPRGNEEELAQVQDLLGSFSTDFSTSSAGRAKNVTNGCSKINGTILYPGDSFDMAKTVSPFTLENGYELAGAYQNGTTVESFGGGICQVATTLYNAVIRAELEITMRFNHSMLVSYVQPSMDAAIAGNYKDLRFKNNLDAPIYIEGYCSGGVIHFNVYGKETRPSNREISFESETVSTTDPETKFNLDSSLPIGHWSVEQSAHTGCVAQLWKIVKVDGEQQSRDLFNKSNYQASPKIITIGTKGANKESLAALKAAVASGDENTVRSAASALKTDEQVKQEEDDKKDQEDSEDSEDKKNDSKEDESQKDDTKKDDSDKKDHASDNKSDNKSDGNNSKSDSEESSN